jgi:predicted AlkP superfamily pyrophosphatase or phosphodiesterase
VDETPRLAVIIAVDGLSWERLNAARPWLSDGLKRLLDEGTVETACRYGHLNTLTGPGHASLATGVPPRLHGIPSNHWFVPGAGKAGMVDVYAASQPLPGEAEGSTRTMAGAGRLRVPTLADRVTKKYSASKVVSIATKDRSAILLAGRDPRHAVYWYDSGTYRSSDAFDRGAGAGAAAAAVVGRFNAEKAGAKLAAHLGVTWSRLPKKGPAAVSPERLASLQLPVLGPTFPHALAGKDRSIETSILWTPFIDRLLADLAVDLLADNALALGRDDVPDVLALSFSSNDYISHDYGPESEEASEALRALDVSIGRILDELTRRVGRERLVVALSADHGFLSLASAKRFSEQTILDGLNAAVNTELSRAQGVPLIYRYDACSLWLDSTALALPGAPERSRVLAIVNRELTTRFKNVIERTFVVDDEFPVPPGDELAARAWNARVPGRSGDLFVVPRYGVLIGSADGKGTTHGSPWEYDVHVPLIFWGAGITPRISSTPTTPYDLAPTLARRLHLEP